MLIGWGLFCAISGVALTATDPSLASVLVLISSTVMLWSGKIEHDGR